MLNVVALAMRAWSQVYLQVHSQMSPKAIALLPLGSRGDRRTFSRLLSLSWPMDLSQIVFNDECSESWCKYSRISSDVLFFAQYLWFFFHNTCLIVLYLSSSTSLTTI